jgi:hypothetical protein
LTTQDKSARRSSIKRSTLGGHGIRHDVVTHLISVSACYALLLMTVLIFLSATQISAADNITWEAYDKAILRIDGDPPKIWGLYHSTHGKQNEVILLLWDKRFLKLNTRFKEVQELDPLSIVHKSKRLESPSDDKAATILPSTEWILRDVGSAYRIRFILNEEKHEIEINLPH